MPESPQTTKPRKKRVTRLAKYLTELDAEITAIKLDVMKKIVKRKDDEVRDIGDAIPLALLELAIQLHAMRDTGVPAWRLFDGAVNRIREQNKGRPHVRL